jgi:hypothetical protein
MIDRHDLGTLILVAGHGMYVAPDFIDPRGDKSWLLQDFQKGEPPLYIEHVACGIDLATADEKSLLVFSGGQTRAEAGPQSEAQSYWVIAEYVLHWKQTAMRSRSTTEEYARDSFENLLFGICRFFECTQRYPRLVKVVSWKFKEKRFDLHRTAIRLPSSRYEFVGVNDPIDLKRAKQGERITKDRFTKDPYGVRMAPPEVPNSERCNYLGEKRKERNPFNRHHPYLTTCPGLAQLLTHSSTNHFNGHVPW